MKLSLIDRLRELGGDYRQKANAIDIVMDLLRDDLDAAHKVRVKTVMNGALAIKGEHLNGHQPAPLLLEDGKKRPAKRRYFGKSTVKQRLRSSKLLELFTEPVWPTDKRLKGNYGRLLANGYLKRLEDGSIVRTDKPFIISGVIDSATGAVTAYVRDEKKKAAAAPPVKHGKFSKQALMERREKTQRFLWKFSPKEARNFPPPKGAGNLHSILVHRGYLVKSGDGYVRTGKEFYLDPAQGKDA